MDVERFLTDLNELLRKDQLPSLERIRRGQIGYHSLGTAVDNLATSTRVCCGQVLWNGDLPRGMSRIEHQLQQLLDLFVHASNTIALYTGREFVGTWVATGSMLTAMLDTHPRYRDRPDRLASCLPHDLAWDQLPLHYVGKLADRFTMIGAPQLPVFNYLVGAVDDVHHTLYYASGRVMLGRDIEEQLGLVHGTMSQNNEARQSFVQLTPYQTKVVVPGMEHIVSRPRDACGTLLDPETLLEWPNGLSA